MKILDVMENHNGPFYRLESDYGYGDKNWITRMRTRDEILNDWATHVWYGMTDKDKAEISDPTDLSTGIYKIEYDSWDDEPEEIDWLDT